MVDEVKGRVVGREEGYGGKVGEGRERLDGMKRRVKVELGEMIENMEGRVEGELKREEEEVGEGGKG